jgi:hypothetical protein
MERRSRFVYGPEGSEVTLDTTISVRPWLPIDRTVGGSRTSAAGVPASYVVRQDSLLVVTLRFWESEWLGILNLLTFGRSDQSFLWFPDVDDTGTSVEVYLETPIAGEDATPTRDGEFPRVMELVITLRGVGTAVPWLPYFQMHGA